MKKVKTSAIPYTGYNYQTYQGMSWLLDWLANPSRFLKMRFECNDKDLAPQGLEDIVAWRSDGKLDYAQVKFTPNNDDQKLSWDWLLKLPSTRRPRSLMMKWVDALSSVDPANVGRARLITNREPDEEFGRCLEGAKVDFDTLSADRQREVVSQLGDESAARRIFGALEIEHSNTGYLALPRVMMGELVKLGYDETSFHRLFHESTQWATHDNLPAPNGDITLDVVRSVLSTLRPEPISQEFEVPTGYRPPDTTFHSDLLEKLSKSDSDKNLHVLWGAPGRGKSTYLSYLTHTLDEKAIPVIRHHYFLSTTDRSTDRMRLYAVANSLLAQIARLRDSDHASTRHEELRREITECAEEFRKIGVPLVIIIDGLDHVWRREKDMRPLNELFEQLIPVPANSHLIIGTQPVVDEQLPSRLLAWLARDKWSELPPMSVESILAYVVSLVRSRRWMRNKNIRQSEELRACSVALHLRTGGHPLHLIFSIEDLLRRSNPPREYLIQNLPACPDNDIRKYYEELWLKLSRPQQDSLHLICELPFYWPVDAFAEISNNHAVVSTDGITHLLFECAVGYRPFHESLAVFVTGKTKHNERIASLLPKVEEWLASSAPAVIGNSWLYSLRAKRGDHAQLAQTLTREWVLERLVEGYPAATIERLLREAEQYMFDDGELAEACRLRSIKHRVNQGPQFQIDDMQLLHAMCWAVSVDESLLDETIANAALLSPMRQGSLSRALSFNRDPRASKMARRAINRFQSEYRFKNRQHSSRADQDFQFLLERLAASGALRIEYFTEPSVLDDEPRERLLATLTGLVQAQDLSALFILHKHASTLGNAKLIEQAILEVAVETGVKLHAWSESRLFWANSVAVLHLALTGRGSDDVFTRDALPNAPTEWKDNSQFEAGFGSLLIHSFFSSLALHFLSSATVCILPPLNSHGNPELLMFQSAMERAGETAAILLKSQGRVDYEFIFEQTKHVPILSGHDYESMDRYQGVKRALHQIAIRLQVFCMAQNATGLISPQSIARAKECKHFSVARLMADAADVHIRLLQPELLGDLVTSELSNVQAANREIGETIESLMELAQLCLIQRSRDDVRRICHSIWELVLGYGKHKDTSILELLNAIEHMAFADKEFATEQLLSVSGVIEKVTTFTDGDETHNVHRYVAEALREGSPPFLAKKYSYHLERGEWYEAQETIREALKNINHESPFTAALARTGLTENEMPKSWRASESGDAAHSIYLASLDFLGLDVTIEKPDTYASPESKQFEADFKQYRPSDFAKLLRDMRDSGHYFERESLRSWYQYWTQADHSNLVKSLHKYLDQDNDCDAEVRYVLDQLFDSTLSLFGRDRAFYIAVLAQVENGGWSSWGMSESRDASRARLRKVAEIYPERALEFVAESCTRPNKMFGKIVEPSYTIPGVNLIYFLVQAKQVDLAKSYLVSMVGSLRDETQMFSLPRPAWSLAQPLSDAELPLQLLIARLKSGVATTRLWAMQELIGLLQSEDTRSIVESVLQAHIRLIRLDTELIEVLGLLWVARIEGLEFSRILDVGEIVSTLSVELCDMLELTYSRRPVLLAPQGYRAGRDFFKVDGLPERIGLDLGRLQDAIRFPAVSQASFEAERLVDTVRYDSSVRFFFGAERGQMNGALLTNATQIARTAYLRSISVAREFTGFSVERVLDWSSSAIPFSPLFMGVRSVRPNFWLALRELILRNELFVSDEVFGKFIDSIGGDDKVLGALKVPIYRSENEFVLLEIRLCAYQANMNFEEVLAELPADDELSQLLRPSLLGDEGLYCCEHSSKVMEKDRARMLAVSFMVIPHAYLHLELFQRGVYLPISYESEEEFFVVPEDFGLSVISAHGHVGDISYWNTEWSPTYPSTKGPGCGTLLTIQRDALHSLVRPGELFGYRCTLARYRRDYSYSEFEESSRDEYFFSFV
ncbi:NACHT domain-containing protein [Janthinobacterium sp. SUN120]|uniref:NACHT domain-containing protein n=1 Tax=Janthinobacterium sp. SUN120 TaxID=3004099 RepID=UPI0025B0AE5D|nr:NACHT domain-containing protein [Janthinobacterium sp. SUN120]MDN2713689.1 NACHT domain-containing protein [Janthinobacterium sp. SUN120]